MSPPHARFLLAISLVLAGLNHALPASSPRADVVIYGATPGGIATAVRAAREGLRVVLVHHHRHIGGMPANGLGVFDTVYRGERAPLYREIRALTLEGYPANVPEAGNYEPRAAEAACEKIVAAEKNITLRREFHPVAVEKGGRLINTVTFQRMGGKERLVLPAGAFVDASYEGDLAHVAGAQMIVGREGRAQYGEPHAGRVFTKLRPLVQPYVYELEGVNLRAFPLEANELLPGSTGEADAAVQAYNFRVCWTRNPANRLPVQKPARYERDIFLELKDRWQFTNRTPNQKTSWNAPLLIGGNFDYPNGDWPARDAITARHRDLATGLLWFLQNDPVVPAAIQQEAREWGLPKDEFTDNGGFPWEMYVREARRLVGRHVFTQHDGMMAPGFGRAPIHPDSIAITEWPLDSHACTMDSVSGSDHEGKVLLSQETRPGMIPYRCLLPKELDNLLVTGCVSSSHIGWGTLRLEPVWMHLGESAAYALALARRTGRTPATVSTVELQALLVSRDIMLSFFNDFDMAKPTAAQRAAQYFGTRGYFATYQARLEEPLNQAVAKVWAKPSSDPQATARRVAIAEGTAGTITGAEFAGLSDAAWPDAPNGPLTRGDACVWLFARSQQAN